MADDLLGRYAEGGGSQLIPTTRVFFKKTKRGKIARLVREHYLRFSREEVEREQLFPVSMAVRSALLGSFFPLLRQEADTAQGQQQEATAELLAEGLPRHYVIPDVETTKHFLELFEFDHRLTDIIWLGTVLHEMREASQRAYNRLRAVVGDPRHRGMVFQNEHFAETWVPRLDTETPTQRNQRAIRKAVVWVQGFIQREWERTTVLQQQNKAIQEMEAGNKDDGEVEVEEEEGKGERKKKRRGRRGKKKLTADQTLTVMPQVIVLTQSKDLVLDEEKRTTVVGGSLFSQNKATESNVKCMTCQEYVDTFFADDVQLKELCDSLTQLLLLGEDRSSDKDLAGKGYEEYRADDVLEAELKSGAIWRGTLRVSTHNNAEAYVRTNDHSGLSSDILIQGKANMNRAIHGDLVAVELFPRERWAAPSVTLRRQGSGQGQDQEEAGVEQGDDATTTGRSRKVFPTGKVVGIFQRNWRPYVVTLQLEHGENSSASEKLDKEDSATSQSSATQAVLCIPMDYKIPKIRIRTRNTEFLKDQRFIVAIDSWEKDSFYPNGHYVLSLGPIGDLETETAALLTENSVSAPPFPAAILNSLPSLTGPDAWAITEEDVASRRDIRESHRVYSIDPLGCQDIDDALSVRFLNDGKIEIGVHIADVTHFVPHNSLLDIEARARGTSVYLADRRLDMLPSLLSEQLCSLRGGQDRFAVSVLWTFASDFQTVERTWFGRTIIRSCHEFHYELCQSILDEALSESEREKLPDYDLLRKELLVLLEVSSKMQRKRTRQGALILASTEAKFELSETRSPTSILAKKELPVHDLVAEFMILANQYVAEQIYSAYPDAALLRRHPFPRNSKKFQELIEAAEARGFRIDTTSNKTLARSLDAAVVPEDPSVNRLLRQLATKAMEEAQYVSTGSYDIHDLYHHGLALNMYTHFTSPIRRYADVIVHRQLLGSLIRPTKAPAYFNDEKLEETAQHINKKHRNAKHASKASSELFKTMYFKQTPDNLVDGIIYQMKANGFVVAIPRYGLKGAVYLRDKDGQLIVPSNALSLSPTAYTSDLRIVDYRFEPTQQSILLKVTSAKEQQQQLVGVHLFDHVTLHVVVDESRAHRPSVKLELVHFGMDPKLKEEAAKQYAAGGGTRVNTTKAVLEHQKELAAAAAADESDEEAGTSLIAPTFRTRKMVTSRKLLKELESYKQTKEEDSLYALCQRLILVPPSKTEAIATKAGGDESDKEEEEKERETAKQAASEGGRGRGRGARGGRGGGRGGRTKKPTTETTRRREEDLVVRRWRPEQLRKERSWYKNVHGYNEVVVEDENDAYSLASQATIVEAYHWDGAY